MSIQFLMVIIVAIMMCKNGDRHVVNTPLKEKRQITTYGTHDSACYFNDDRLLFRFQRLL